MSQVTFLNLNKFPQIPQEKKLLKWRPLKEFPQLKNLGSISERIFGCAHHNRIENYSDLQFYAEKANIRAALNEFVSISEMLKKEHAEIMIHNTDLPLLHFFKELRTSNFHIKTFVPNVNKEKAILSGGVSDPIEGELEIFIIGDCNLDLFKDNRHYPKYTSPEFRKTVEWVNEKQNIWGISHVINAALKQYCELIKKTVTNIKG